MGIFVKICGLTSAEAVEGVVALKPDAIGFVFWAGSKRNVEPSDVAAWTKGIPERVLKVGVFVDPSRDELAQIVQQAGLDVVQLPNDIISDVCEGLSCRVWSVLHLDAEKSEELTSYPVDAFLVDSYSTESPGGTGQVCDWQTAKAFIAESTTDVLLAGGLKAANVEEAIREVGPWGVDVSSGVESAPGQKDLEQVKEFIARCRKQ